MSSSIPAFPLQWPIGWKRTAYRADAKFRKGTGGWKGPEGAARYESAARVDLSEGLNRLYRELRNLGVPDNSIVVSTNLKLRLDGMPYSTQATSGMDPGVAVYWKQGGRQRCMAVDRYTRIADNLAAIAATLEAMRAIERHGGAEILDRAFTGFTALPAPEQWFQVLSVSASATKGEIEVAYRRLAMEHHPDRPRGSADAMARINQARDEGLSQALG